MSALRVLSGPVLKAPGARGSKRNSIKSCCIILTLCQGQIKGSLHQQIRGSSLGILLKLIMPLLQVQ